MTEPLWVPWPVVPAICVLCGATGPEVRMMLIRWREGDPYGSGPRCSDAEGCWTRCLANGDDWPVDDSRPARARAPGPVESHSLRNIPPPDPQIDDDDLDFGEAPA